jgi:peptidoglycan/LPS O-acetylase OafA/YrhL
MSNANSEHQPALDGLRGLAVAGVLLFHTGHLPGGFLGVDLFFTLSGYLITGQLLRGVPLKSFWGRRIRRLAPALALMLGCVTVVVWASAPADLVRTTLADGPWAQTGLLNWHLLAESAGYWDRFGSARVFDHLWSIAVEEQFYLVWPLIVGVVVRRARDAEWVVAVLAALLAAASVTAMVVLLDPADPSRVYTGTDTRAFSLLLGAVVATAPVRSVLRRVPVTVPAVAGLGVMWALADGVRSGWLFTGGLAVHSLMSATLIGLCVHRRESIVARALATWVPRSLGQISYSLYLWHWPVIVLLSPQRTGLRGWAWTALVCTVSVCLAVLSKRLVEDPIRFRARWARGRSGVVAFVGLSAGLLLLWILLPAPPAPVIDIGRLD